MDIENPLHIPEKTPEITLEPGVNYRKEVYKFCENVCAILYLCLLILFCIIIFGGIFLFLIYCWSPQSFSKKN